MPDQSNQGLQDAAEMLKSLFVTYDEDENGMSWEEFKTMAIDNPGDRVYTDPVSHVHSDLEVIDSEEAEYHGEL